MGERLLLPPGDSSEQRKAERLIADIVGEGLGTPLVPYRFQLSTGNHITVDGYSREPPVLVEAWAHMGPPKSAQKNKVMVDALKLHWLRSTLVPGAACILALADEESARPFKSERTWAGDCLRDLGIDVRIVTLSADWRDRILAAQHRQFR